MKGERGEGGKTSNQYKGKAGGCTEWFGGRGYNEGRGKSSYTYCTGMSTITADVTLNFDWFMTCVRGYTKSVYGMHHMLVLRDPKLRVPAR